MYGFGHPHISVGLPTSHACKQGLDLAHLARVELVREGDLEEHEKISKAVRVLMERKTLVRHGHEGIGLDYLSRRALYSELRAIEEVNHEVAAIESL